MLNDNQKTFMKLITTLTLLTSITVITACHPIAQSTIQQSVKNNVFSSNVETKTTVRGIAEFHFNSKEQMQGQNQHFLTSSFTVQSTQTEIATKATVSLIYPSNHPTLANVTIATGITGDTGNFIINPDITFTPEINSVFILEAVKRIGGNGNAIMTLRTYIRWDGTKWDSMTSPGIYINTKTTALAIIQENMKTHISPLQTIGKINISDGKSIPINIGTPVLINSQSVNDVSNLVTQVLNNNFDPIIYIKLINSHYTIVDPPAFGVPSASYNAETGFFQIKGQLSNVNEVVNGVFVNKWFNAKNSYTNNYIFNSTATAETDRNESNTSRISNFIDFKEEPGNINSKTIGRYRITLEDGSFQNGGKTITGSYSEGSDIYNNQIWANTTDKNYFYNQKVFRYGIKIEGYAVNASGNNYPIVQYVYAVLDIHEVSDDITPQEWGYSSPASYMISTNGISEAENNNLVSSYNINFLSNQIITGPVHTNERIDFYWRGNFNTNIPGNKSINDQFTMAKSRGSLANGYDPGTLFVTSIVRETGQPSNQITIYGTGFNSTPGNNYVSFNGGYWQYNAVAPNTIVSSSSTKLVVNIPNSVSIPFTLSVGIASASTGPLTVNSNMPINQPVTPPPSLNILGLMQVSRPNSGQEEVYVQRNRLGEGTGEYRFLDPAVYTSYPFAVDWAPASPEIEPASGQTYVATFITEKNIPHKRINIYDKITYSNAKGSVNPAPKMYYIHSHKSKMDSINNAYTSNHNHRGNIFGKITGNGDVELAMTSKPGNYYRYPPLFYYDWTSKHLHEISGYNYPVSYGFNNGDTFFCFESPSFEPTFTSNIQIAPILKPNGTNALTQREYASTILEIMGKNLRDSSNNLASLSTIAEEKENGYYLGSQDFRATYFGNDLRYADGTLVLPTGSKISDTKLIKVNDNPNSNNYMKVYPMDDNSSSDNKLYTYRQIPKNAPTSTGQGKNIIEGGIIFVNEGNVRIGGMYHKGIVNTTGYVGESPIMGRNTIIDGRLAIIAYSENKPSVYINDDVNNTIDNPGDIVITGNVIYKNKIYKYKDQITSENYTNEGFRQYAVNGTWAPSNINDSSVNWITNSDGSPVVDSNGINKKYNDSTGNETNINSLGLFASNCIKIPVMHYYQDSNEDNYDITLAKQDILTIHGQLIAGHKITQTKFTDAEKGKTSKNDQLIMFGSLYSYSPSNLSYFDLENSAVSQSNNIARIYLFDRTLSKVPLAGSPYFPKDSSYNIDKTYIAGKSFSRIVPGTWKNLTE